MKKNSLVVNDFLSCHHRRSGAGKTTLLSLLSGLTAPTGGTIYLEDKEIDKIDKYEYRSRYVEFAYVDQETAVIEKEISVTDERQKVSITVENRMLRQAIQ